MELRQLQCVVACAETKSFSKAALNLFTTQSNVSKMISALENEIGKKLFDRRPSGIELTENGRLVYKYALDMLACRDKILDSLEEERMEELRISFQPSSWMAKAFGDFYLQNGAEGKRYQIISASLDEIIRRLSLDIDQLGFAYIEEEQLLRLKDIFQKNHIGYFDFMRTTTVLYCGKNADIMPKDVRNAEDAEEEDTLLLIQGEEDAYTGWADWKNSLGSDEINHPARVVVTTNSDYVMQDILHRTELCNISPEYLSHKENAIRDNITEIHNGEQTIVFVCMFRNDRSMEAMPKKFLNYIRSYLQDK